MNLFNRYFTVPAAFAVIASSFGASAQAGYVSITVGQRTNLPSCGGSIEVNNGGHDEQLNVVLRKVEQCSNYSDSTGKSYKLQGAPMNYTGAFTITTANRNSSGTYSVRIQVASNSGAHADTVDVSFRITNPTPTYPTYPPTSGYSAAAIELARSGTINGSPVLAYVAGESNAVLQSRMGAICRSVGANRALNYSVIGASYVGQQVLTFATGSWTWTQVNIPSQVALFGSLNCTY